MPVLRIKKWHAPTLDVPPLHQLPAEVLTALWEELIPVEEMSTLGWGATLGLSGYGRGKEGSQT